MAYAKEHRHRYGSRERGKMYKKRKKGANACHAANVTRFLLLFLPHVVSCFFGSPIKNTCAPRRRLSPLFFPSLPGPGVDHGEAARGSSRRLARHSEKVGVFLVGLLFSEEKTEFFPA